jgi:hypothetical protein
MLLALPFITPLPLPGLSTPFGLAIGLHRAAAEPGPASVAADEAAAQGAAGGFFGKVFAVAARVHPRSWKNFYARASRP